MRERHRPVAGRRPGWRFGSAVAVVVVVGLTPVFGGCRSARGPDWDRPEADGGAAASDRERASESRRVEPADFIAAAPAARESTAEGSASDATENASTSGPKGADVIAAIAPSDFSSDISGANAPAVDATEPATLDEPAAPDEAMDARGAPSKPPLPPRSGEPLIVSGLVGQVNGRPIYVDEFFEPIASQLELLGREKTRREFVAEAYLLIGQRLRDLVINELVYAEALTMVTENQEIGLRYFLKQLEEDVTTSAGEGSRFRADQRLLEESGITVDELVEQEKRRQLIQFFIQKDIEKRVFISWRDIERYYRDNAEEFNPPASIQLRILTVPADDAPRRAAVEQGLADDLPFEYLAGQHGTTLASRQGLLPETPLPNGIENTPLTRWPSVDAVARTLAVGEHGGPVEEGDQLIWVHVEKHEDGAGRSLYEAQLDIQNKIHDQRYAEEQAKYLSDLFGRGNTDDLEEMSLSLLTVALRRWAAPEEE